MARGRSRGRATVHRFFKFLVWTTDRRRRSCERRKFFLTGSRGPAVNNGGGNKKRNKRRVELLLRVVPFSLSLSVNGRLRAQICRPLRRCHRATSAHNVKRPLLCLPCLSGPLEDRGGVPHRLRLCLFGGRLDLTRPRLAWLRPLCLSWKVIWDLTCLVPFLIVRSKPRAVRDEKVYRQC